MAVTAACEVRKIDVFFFLYLFSRTYPLTPTPTLHFEAILAEALLLVVLYVAISNAATLPSPHPSLSTLSTVALKQAR